LLFLTDYKLGPLVQFAKSNGVKKKN